MRKLLLILLIAVFASACPLGKDKQESAIERAAKHPGTVILSREQSQTTPKGAKHFSNKQLSAAQLQLIDDGIALLFASALEDGFNESATKPYSWFEIFTPPYPCVLSPVQRVPAFLIGAGAAYDGTDYDVYNPKGKGVKDGFSAVYAAEYVISIGTPNSRPPVAQLYVCPDVSVLKDAVRHGGDHVYLANFPYTEQWRKAPPFVYLANFPYTEQWRKAPPFDGYSYFNRSLTHETNINHPLIPRNNRLAENLVSAEDALSALPVSQERPVSEDMKDFADGLNIKLTGKEKEVQGIIIRVVQ